MYTDADTLVQAIHSTPTMASIATTGGGTYIFPMLLEKGNGSKTLIGGFVPYDPAEHEDFLGGKSDKWVAEMDARALAMIAYMRAQKHKPNQEVVGIGATSSLMRVERDGDGNFLAERKGRKHSIFIALQTARRTITHTLVYSLDEEMASVIGGDNPLDIRVAEERLTANLILNLLAEGCGVSSRIHTFAEEEIIRKEAIATEIHPNLPQLFFFNDHDYVGVSCNNGVITPLPNYYPPNGLIPGSFNPIHEGHRQMRKELKDYLTVQMPEPVVGYEIAIKRADKPPIDYLSLKERLQHIANHDETASLYITNATKFVDKALLFSNCTFGLGFDTAERLIDPIYYDNSIPGRDEALKVMRDRGTRFMVFGRQDPDTKEFLGLENLDNDFFTSMAIGVHETRFRSNLRSRDIRNGKTTVEQV